MDTANGDCLGWAARDPSGVLSPYTFTRRALGSDEVSVRITHCGVCYADIVWTRNKHGDALCPVVPVGSNVHHFRVVDHVGVGTYVNSCRDCEFCNNNLDVYCKKGAVYTFNGIDADGTVTKGGDSTYILVRNRILHNYPLASAVPLLCAGITVYSLIMRHKMDQPGKSLGVVGLGGLGHMAVKFGTAFGLNVTVFSTSLSKKEEALNLLGADKFVISSDKDQKKALANSLDLIDDAASGDHSFDLYMIFLKSTGVLALVGYPNEIKLSPASLLLGTWEISMLKFSKICTLDGESVCLVGQNLTSFVVLENLVGMKTISSNIVGGPKETQEMIDFCVEKGIYPNVEVIPCQYANEALDRLIKKDVTYRFVVDIENSLK